MMSVESSESVNVKLFISSEEVTDLSSIVDLSSPPESLEIYTVGGGPAH